jgi:hypothetical protein
VNKFSTNFIYRGSKFPVATLDGRDEAFSMSVTHQSVKEACTSVNVLEEIALELLKKESLLSRFEIEKIQLHLIDPVQERNIIYGIM